MFCCSWTVTTASRVEACSAAAERKIWHVGNAVPFAPREHLGVLPVVDVEAALHRGDPGDRPCLVDVADAEVSDLPLAAQHRDGRLGIAVAISAVGMRPIARR